MPKFCVFIPLLLIHLILPFSAFADNDSLLLKIKTIAQDAKGKVSVSAFAIEDSISVSYYGDELCVMQSVFKYPIAIAILNKIDKGDFSLQHKIHFTPEYVAKYTTSLMRDSFYNGNINVTFDKLIRYMVAQSDNISCDALLHHLGKPKEVAKFIRKQGIEDFEIRYNEMDMHKKWQNQYSNVCSPNAMVQLLTKFYQGKILSKTNTDYLYQVMLETTTGKNRIVNLLPKGTPVAHKTGTSETEKGMTAATNDVGIITLPNGKHIALAVFVNDAYAEGAVLESVIARIAKAIYDDAIQK